jgi:hypothetical protein
MGVDDYVRALAVLFPERNWNCLVVVATNEFPASAGNRGHCVRRNASLEVLSRPTGSNYPHATRRMFTYMQMT